MPDIATIATAYIAACRVRGRSEKTTRDYAATIHRLQAYLSERQGSLTAANLTDYFQNLQDGTRSPETIRTYARTLKIFLSWAYRQAHITEDLSKAIPMPKKPTRKPKAPPPGALEKLLQTCKTDALGLRDRTLILLLADTGARAGEICSLATHNLADDLESAIVNGKGNKQREIFLHPLTQAALRDWLDTRPPGGPWIFPSGSNHLQPNGLGQMLRRRAKAAGIEGPTNPHAWRHFFALSYLTSGADIVSLASLLGHSNLTTTREYLRWTNRDLQEKHRRYTPINALENPRE